MEVTDVFDVGVFTSQVEEGSWKHMFFFKRKKRILVVVNERSRINRRHFLKMGVTCLYDDDGKESSREGEGDAAKEKIARTIARSREMRLSGTPKSVLMTSSTGVFMYLCLRTTLTHFVESLLKWFKILHFSLVILCQQKVCSTEMADRIKMKPLWCSMM